MNLNFECRETGHNHKRMALNLYLSSIQTISVSEFMLSYYSRYLVRLSFEKVSSQNLFRGSANIWAYQNLKKNTQKIGYPNFG